MNNTSNVEKRSFGASSKNDPKLNHPDQNISKRVGHDDEGGIPKI